MPTVSERLRAMRAAHNYSVEAIADSVGMARSTLSEWEGKAPRALAHLARLARRYEVSADFLVGLTDDPTPIWRDAPPPPAYAAEMVQTMRLLGAEDSRRLLIMAQALAEHEEERREVRRIETRVAQIAQELDPEALDQVMLALIEAARTGDQAPLFVALEAALGEAAPEHEVE
jgi:transcriptional regulator with XRE-family HTH domain